MASISVYSDVTNEDLAKEINKGKDLILEQLRKDGIINKKQELEYSLQYGIVIGSPSLFSVLWEKFLPEKYKDNNSRFMLVKLLNLETENTKDVIS